MFYPVVFSLYNPSIVYGNLELAPPTELQLVRYYLSLNSICTNIITFQSKRQRASFNKPIIYDSANVVDFGSLGFNVKTAQVFVSNANLISVQLNM